MALQQRPGQRRGDEGRREDGKKARLPGFSMGVSILPDALGVPVAKPMVPRRPEAVEALIGREPQCCLRRRQGREARRIIVLCLNNVTKLFPRWGEEHGSLPRMPVSPPDRKPRQGVAASVSFVVEHFHAGKEERQEDGRWRERGRRRKTKKHQTEGEGEPEGAVSGKPGHQEPTRREASVEDGVGTEGGPGNAPDVQADKETDEAELASPRSKYLL